jgi:hypothetical protein
VTPMVLRRLSFAVASLATAAGIGLALIGGMKADTARASGGLGPSACNLLNDVGATRLVGGDPDYPAFVRPQLNGCFVGACWQTFTDPDTGAQQCAYGHGATLTLGRAKSAKVAVNFVRSGIRQGYQPVKVKRADLAGIRSNDKGGGMIIAVGRTTALYVLGGYSDNGTDDDWGYDPRVHMLPESRRLARDLHISGCPAHPGKCPGGA